MVKDHSFAAATRLISHKEYVLAHTKTNAQLLHSRQIILWQYNDLLVNGENVLGEVFVLFS